MALLHRATMTPSKIELLREWVPTRPWFPMGEQVEQHGAYRFDDPAGEVGIETILLRASGGSVLQVPLTYRSAPIPGAERSLVGRCEHSVLGERFVHDATFDPVWLTALVTAVLTGGTQAREQFEVDGRLQERKPGVTVSGTGSAGTLPPELDEPSVREAGATTLVHAGTVEVVLARLVGTLDTAVGDAAGPGTHGLLGRLGPQAPPSVLALVRPLVLA